MPQTPPPDLVDAAIEIFLAYPRAGQDGVLAAMTGRGIAPEDAWRLYQVVPTAFCRVALEDRGIVFSERYEIRSRETDAATVHEWAHLPLYRAALEASRARVERGMTQEEMLSIAGHSAEYDAIRKFARGDDLRDIHLTEMILFDRPPVGL